MPGPATFRHELKESADRIENGVSMQQLDRMGRGVRLQEGQQALNAIEAAGINKTNFKADDLEVPGLPQLKHRVRWSALRAAALLIGAIASWRGLPTRQALPPLNSGR